MAKYIIGDEEYASIYLLKQVHPELVFSSKADTELLALIGITVVEGEDDTLGPDDMAEESGDAGKSDI